MKNQSFKTKKNKDYIEQNADEDDGSSSQASDRLVDDSSALAREGLGSQTRQSQVVSEGVSELRDAIIELYLAIKIRSTEEVSKV